MESQLKHMKIRVHPTRHTVRLLGTLAAVLGLLLVAGSAPAQVRPTHRPDLPDFDTRTAAAPNAARLAEKSKGTARLTGNLSTVAVEFDSLLDTPKFVRAKDGLLTSPGGKGRSVSLLPSASAVAAPGDNLAPLTGFLDEHRDLFGFGSDILKDARVKRDSVGANNGLRTIVWEQQLDGIPLYGSVLIGNITRDGALASVSSLFIPDTATAADAGTPNRVSLQTAPTVSAAQAVALAGQNIGMNLKASELTSVPGLVGEGNYSVFKTPEDAYVRQVWLPLSRSSLRLGWEVMVSSHVTKERFRMVVDAQTGEVKLRQNLTCYISDATYTVYPSDSPSPFSPGLQTPGTYQPPTVNRTQIITPALDTTASPEGWIPDGTNTTTGNNIDAFVDRNFDQQPDQPRPVGNPDRVFSPPLDLTLDPTNYIDGSTVQLFWRANWYHDRLYQFGFTESAGNYQDNNFGRGGLGNDHIICYVQAGADVGYLNNSMFAPAPDGISGQCYMFVFNGPRPMRDGSLDSDVVCHELTHGTSWRLVGGGMNLGSLQGNGMGEGWSDLYALCLLGSSTDDPNAAYQTGGYVTYNIQGSGMTQNYYYGIRHFPYCTDTNKNPFTFKDIDPAQISPHTGVPRSPIYPFDAAEAKEVHHQGEVWCTTLWEMHANLVAKYGWVAGNHLTLQLTTDGLILTPPLPNFLQARDAILLADQIDNGGANQYEIWKAFAKRGMGYHATSPDGSTTAGVVEAYDLPGLSVDHVLVSGGNGNGVIDNNECNDLFVYVVNQAGYGVTNLTGRLSTTNAGVIIVGPPQAYPNLPQGETNANIAPFRVSTMPSFVCGTPIYCTLVLKSDQSTTTNTFVIPTGVPGVPVRFDNSTPFPIPDRGETNSPVLVTNVNAGIAGITVSLYISHNFDSDLLIQLISPAGITNTLSANNGGAGTGYGLGCVDVLRTTFDDASTNPVTKGFAPFVGTYQPQSPLSIYNGLTGTNVNGIWRLRVVDQSGLDTGSIQCWSLAVTPALCIDGGGECPGADLAIGMAALPTPVVLGQYLTYTINVTNNGPSVAKNTLVTHQLPAGLVFVSAVSSQGACSQAAGLVTGNLGTLPVGGTAVMTVVAIPTVQGTITSSATVSSSQIDPDPSNNSVTLATQVNPATADLALSLVANPSPGVLGATLTYTITVTNRGPSDASGVIVSNLFPASVTVLSTSVSQGSISPSGTSWVIGTLLNGGGATATVTVAPSVQGTLATTSTVTGNQIDLIPGNNTVTLLTPVGPSADLALGLSDFPNPQVVLSNVTYVLSVTNLGPSGATGVNVTQFLPAGAPVLSTNAAQGTVSVTGNNLAWNIGSLASGAKTTLTVIIGTSTNGTLITSASVAAAEPDPNTANNSASAATRISPPGVAIAAAGATLTAESFVPPNGAIDIGETVTIILRLRNSSNVATVNLVGTLQTNNGVTPVFPNSPQNYGVLAPSGFAVGRPFSFTASGTNGQTITPTLTLTDGATTYPPISFSFTLPVSQTFSSTNAIAIRDNTNGLPYPSTILVSNLSGTLGRVSATVSQLTHTFAPDIDILLVNPAGQKSILMSAAGGNSAVENTTLTFDDSAADPIPSAMPIYSGAFKPANYLGNDLPVPAPVGPYPAAMSTFNGSNPNGTWSLYVADHTSGDTGSIAGGWSLTFTSISPVNQLADLALTVADAPDPVAPGSLLTYTFTVANLGPNPATSVAFTNVLPAGVTLVSASSSQGVVVTNASTILASLGTISSNGTATVTIGVVPSLGFIPVGFNSALLTNTANVAASETDPNPANNVASAHSTVQRPNAGLLLASTLSPVPGITTLPLTNTIVITNAGPGAALSVVLTNPLPAGASFVSATSTVGTCSFAGGVTTCLLGDLASNATATVTIIVTPSLVGNLTNVVSAATISQNTNVSTLTSVIAVAQPVVQVINAGAALTYESGPVNGLIDPGETVTVAFSLANVGSLDTVNLKAALEATGGVLSPSGIQSYGTLVHQGPSTSQSFTFTSGAAQGASLVATLKLQDERPGVTNQLPAVAFTFVPPVLSGWVNTNGMTIPDHGVASTYPSTINISGLGGVVTRAVVTLKGVTHQFPHDINALLVSPSGSTVLLMSHTGGGHSATNLTLTFDDAATGTLPNSDALASGTNKPSGYPAAVTLPPGAPARPYGTSMGSVCGGTPNGTWALYVFDDAVGDSGSIAGGWTLNLSTATTLRAIADLGVTMTTVPGSLFVGGTITNTVTVTNVGPAAATGILVTNSLSSGGQIVTPVGALAANASTTFTVVLAPDAAGNIVNTVTVGGNEADLNPANNIAQNIVSVTAPNKAVLEATMQGGQIHLTITAEPNAVYAILASPNLASWTAISTNTASVSGVIKFTDTNSPSFQTRYYRTKLLTP
jgi:uncharacterized repeat protein (TIGR01451 family)